MNHPVFAIAVIMERRALANRWQAQKWEAIGIVPDPGDAATPRVLLQNDTRAQWLHGGFELKLYRDEAENYYLNLSAPQPCVFITWRMRGTWPCRNSLLSVMAKRRASWTRANRWTAYPCRATCATGWVNSSTSTMS